MTTEMILSFGAGLLVACAVYFFKFSSESKVVVHNETIEALRPLPVKGATIESELLPLRRRTSSARSSSSASDRLSGDNSVMSPGSPGTATPMSILSPQPSASHISLKEASTTPLHEGHLYKKATAFTINPWQKRYFVLHNTQLLYYQSALKTKLPRSIDIAKIENLQISLETNTLNISVTGSERGLYILRAEDFSDLQKWEKLIKERKAALAATSAYELSTSELLAAKSVECDSVIEDCILLRSKVDVLEEENETRADSLAKTTMEKQALSEENKALHTRIEELNLAEDALKAKTAACILLKCDYAESQVKLEELSTAHKLGYDMLQAAKKDREVVLEENQALKLRLDEILVNEFEAGEAIKTLQAKYDSMCDNHRSSNFDKEALASEVRKLKEALESAEKQLCSMRIGFAALKTTEGELRSQIADQERCRDDAISMAIRLKMDCEVHCDKLTQSQALTQELTKQLQSSHAEVQRAAAKYEVVEINRQRLESRINLLVETSNKIRDERDMLQKANEESKSLYNNLKISYDAMVTAIEVEDTTKARLVDRVSTLEVIVTDTKEELAREQRVAAQLRDEIARQESLQREALAAAEVKLEQVTARLVLDREQIAEKLKGDIQAMERNHKSALVEAAATLATVTTKLTGERDAFSALLRRKVEEKAILEVQLKESFEEELEDHRRLSMESLAESSLKSARLEMELSKLKRGTPKT